MPRFNKDSDDDFELKPGCPAIGRMQTRMLATQSVSSPLRRSSRIKQIKYSPDSESDSSSVSNSQTTWSTRTRTATMDSAVSDTTKKPRTRMRSVSSEISEADVDIPGTPGKRVTRQSSVTPVGTPTRVTRAASKRFVRAGSETVTQSPLPAARITRKTRASSVELMKSLSDQDKDRSDSPVKTRKRASFAKEQLELEDRVPYVRLDATIFETDEIVSSGNSDSSPNKASHLPQSRKIKKYQRIINKNEVEEDDSYEKMDISTDSSKDEIFQSLEKKDEIQTKDIDKTAVNILTEEQKLEKTPSSHSDEISIYSSSSSGRRNSAKTDELKTVKVKCLLDDKALIDICESINVSKNVPENLLDTSTEEQKSDKENEVLNVNSDIEKNVQSNVISSCIKSLASSFVNKSLDEKETRSMRKELNKRRHSRDSPGIAIKHDGLSKEATDNSQEKMDIPVAVESSNSTATNEAVLLQHESTKTVAKVVNEDKTFIENISTSTNEDTSKIINESDKEEYIVIDDKNSNKVESDKVDETLHSSISLDKSIQIESRDDNGERFDPTLATDDSNEMKLILEEQSSSCRDGNEISLNVHSKPDQVDVQVLLSINENSDDRIITLNKVVDSSTEEKREQENFSKRVTESISESSNTTLKTNTNDAIIQDDQSSDMTKISKKSTMDILPEKIAAKDISLEKIVKQDLKRQSTDDLEREKKSSQMETNQKNEENVENADDVSDVDGIDLFQDIPADKWKEKSDIKTDLVQSTPQLVEEVENDNEANCDLILMHRQAWLAAETIKAVKEAEPFEYDSDDTVLLKSLDEAQASYNAKKFDSIDEEFTDTDNERNEKQIKKRKSRTERRLASEIDQDSSRCTEDEDNLVTADKSFNESKTALNRTNDRSISRLNKLEQSRTKEQSSKASSESDKEIEVNVSKLNRSSLISKKNTSLRKSMERRTSLNKSSGDTDTSMQNVSANIFRVDDSEEEFDNTDARIEKKLYKKKRSLNKSRNEDANDDDAIKSEKKTESIIEDSNKKDEDMSLNSSMDQKSKSRNIKTIHLKDDESHNSDVSIVAMDLGFKTSSMIAHAGSDSDQSEYDIPNYLFAKANSDIDTDSSNNSDINKEYNLDGVESKFSDDNIPSHECRTSEVEFSDSDDSGSDLTDFIVNDDDLEDEEKETEDEDVYSIKEDDESENERNEENNEATCEKIENKEAHIDMEDKNIEDNEGVQEEDYAANREEDAKENKFAEMEADSSYASTSGKLSKIHKNKNKSIEYISSHKNDTEIKRDIKMKKSSMEKNGKTILLDSSNSDLSIKKKKKKSLLKENDTILLDASNLISSSIKKKDRKSDPQYSSRDEAERDSSEELNKYEFLSAKKLSKSHELMKFSTPNLNSDKKLKLDKIFKRISENNEAIESDNTSNAEQRKATQNTSINKEKSKKDSTLNEDINLKKFRHASKERSDFSPDLLKLLENTSLSKSTSCKIELHKTMNIVDSETPTLKYLRKEKLNESAPTLKSNVESSSLAMEKKDTAQIKVKEKKNKIPDLIILSGDDAVQKQSQKKRKKRKRRDASEKNIEALSEDELDVPKKKKAKLAQLTTIDDNIYENAYEIGEKKKKKKKKQDIKENITDEALSEDAVELKSLKQKKPVKLTILDNDIYEDAYQINEKKKKKKKKQDMSKEKITDKVLPEHAVKLKISKSEALSEDELDVPKKKKSVKLTQLTITNDNIREAALTTSEEKKKKKKKQNTSRENVIDESLTEDAVELKTPKKKKRSKLIQLPITEDNENMCQINEKEKRKKQEIKKKNIFENISEEALSEDANELKIPKKKTRIKFNQLAVTDDICKSAYQINEKEKKKKKRETLKENIEKVLFEDAELKISKKKKHATLDQLAIQDIIQDNIRRGAYQISEKEKRKEKKYIIVAEEDENVNEDNIPRKNIRENKTKLAQQKKNKSLKLDSLRDKHIEDNMTKKKTKKQEIVKNIETLRTGKKKKTLPVQIPVSKLKSDKNVLARKDTKSQKTTLDASESKDVVYETQNPVEATAKMCILKELKKKKRDRVEDIEDVVHANVPTKISKKEVKEVMKLLPSSSGLKRLSDDVIENLTDMPTRAKKRRKISRIEEQIAPSVKATTTDSSFMLSTSGCTTQFDIVNLQNVKKQPSKGAAAAASFRERMLARNNREPISAYLMYRDKMNSNK